MKDIFRVAIKCSLVYFNRKENQIEIRNAVFGSIHYSDVNVKLGMKYISLSSFTVSSTKKSTAQKVTPLATT